MTGLRRSASPLPRGSSKNQGPYIDIDPKGQGSGYEDTHQKDPQFAEIAKWL